MRPPVTGDSGGGRPPEDGFAYDPTPIRYPVPPALAPLDFATTAEATTGENEEEPEETEKQENSVRSGGGQTAVSETDGGDTAAADLPDTAFEPLMYEPGIEAVTAPEEPDISAPDTGAPHTGARAGDDDAGSIWAAAYEPVGEHETEPAPEREPPVAVPAEAEAVEEVAVVELPRETPEATVAQKLRGAIGLVVVVVVAGIALAAVVGATVAALAFAARRLAGG